MARVILLLVVLITQPLNAAASEAIAFTVALRPPGASSSSHGFDSMGPYNVHTRVVYQHEITNIGRAYNSATGIFTAPVKGAYFFTFTHYAWVKSVDIGVMMMKNGQEVLMVWETQGSGDNEDYGSNSVVLELVAGDTIYMKLPEGFWHAASHYHNINTFTGFLLPQTPSQDSWFISCEEAI